MARYYVVNEDDVDPDDPFDDAQEIESEFGIELVAEQYCESYWSGDCLGPDDTAVILVGDENKELIGKVSVEAEATLTFYGTLVQD